ncbi:glycoside hydrolase family 5 protein [Suhomyces tanzawaensis NRRL Y-17324]|uniref:Glucan 1,3-beta-glucosidase n=1 Tax=Suhomyces tanzawaensis NRRL Y-17324 TaxID=984487 RepID=A0A1E4SMQ5_9ASCO|nr:glycoside hydrolase family 5 protein [Suhomyces tanzawaensis NRRL Y-17324]ODV80809.1 glycoside hydrolase family 5 protein [Suhomyces tanzawaensis NRRL Y-17324]
MPASHPLAPNGNLKVLTERGQSWDYQNDKIRGVNLGGWFVLEPYITPSLFTSFEKGADQSQVPVDEYHFTKQLGKQLAESRLQAHWSSWYTEKDFEQIQSLGLNFVRIPIGYWAFELLPNDPYVQGQVQYLDQALAWCRQYNLKAWVDLHGAPGSQNGFDNSGLRTTIDWQNGNNVQVTLSVLDTIFEKYGNGNYSDIVIGIELVNEPLGPSLNMDEIKDFYLQGYKNLRATGSVTPVILHDAFQQQQYWNGFATVENGDYWNVVIDHHHYQVFAADQLSWDIDQHVQVACGWGKDALKEDHWNVAGEWSAALTDCALWLNGVGRGARWSGDYDNAPYIDSCDAYTEEQNWSSEYRQNVRKYIEAQLDAFEQTGGWVFWNWKTENAVEWDFQRLTEAGVFPQPLNKRQYPNQCGF